MKNIIDTINEAQMISIDKNWDQKLVDNVGSYFKLIKPKSKYASFDDQVDELVSKVEKLVVAITNEYTRGNVCAALLKWFKDSEKVLKEQAEQDKES